MHCFGFGIGSVSGLVLTKPQNHIKICKDGLAKTNPDTDPKPRNPDTIPKNRTLHISTPNRTSDADVNVRFFLLLFFSRVSIRVNITQMFPDVPRFVVMFPCNLEALGAVGAF